MTHVANGLQGASAVNLRGRHEHQRVGLAVHSEAAIGERRGQRDFASGQIGPEPSRLPEDRHQAAGRDRRARIVAALTTLVICGGATAAYCPSRPREDGEPGGAQINERGLIQEAAPDCG